MLLQLVISVYFSVLITVGSAEGKVPLKDGNSEKGAHVWSDLGSLICLRHLFRSRAVTDMTSFHIRLIFHHTCTIFPELPSNISTIIYSAEGK